MRSQWSHRGISQVVHLEQTIQVHEVLLRQTQTIRALVDFANILRDGLRWWCSHCGEPFRVCTTEFSVSRTIQTVSTEQAPNRAVSTKTLSPCMYPQGDSHHQRSDDICRSHLWNSCTCVSCLMWNCTGVSYSLFYINSSSEKSHNVRRDPCCFYSSAGRKHARASFLMLGS